MRMHDEYYGGAEMFRCDWCENYYDKSECECNPLDECSTICWDCLESYKEEAKAYKEVEHEQ